MKRKAGHIIAAVLIVLTVGFLVYTCIYYHADALAIAALASDEQVSISRTSCGWYFDGPSKDHALVFYPSGKVEEIAYASFLHALAARRMDVCLLKCPSA